MSQVDANADSSSSLPPPEENEHLEIDRELLKRFVRSNTTVRCFPVVEGLSKTAPETVLKELEVVAQSATIRDLIRNAEYAKFRWKRLNIFTNVDFHLEPLSDGAPEDVVIRFYFSEKKALKELSIMTSDSGTMPEIKATLQNVFGRAYELSCHVTPSSLRTVSSAAHLVSHLSYFGDRTEYILSKSSEPHPLHYGDQERIEQAKIVVHFDSAPSFFGWSTSSAALEQEQLQKVEQGSRQQGENGNDENDESALSGYREPTPSKWKQSVTFGFQQRRLIPRGSTPEIVGDGSGTAVNNVHWRGIPNWLQHHFAPATKAFLKYQLTYNDVQFLPMPWYEAFSLPVAGTNFTASAEVGGGLLGGETSLCKTEFQVINHKTLFPFVVLDLAFRGGFAAGFGGHDWVGDDARWSEVRMSDRFYLNWRNVRGFLAIGPNTNTEAAKHNDVPPRRFRCLGGNVVWAASATLNFPLPVWPSNGLVSSHLFANVGNLAFVDNFSHLWSSLSDIVAKPRASVGFGLTAMQIPALGPVPNGRLELNFAVPVISSAASFADGAASPWVFDKIRWGLHWTSL